MCCNKARELPHLLLDLENWSVTDGYTEARLRRQPVEVTCNGHALAQLEIDYLPLDLMDDERGHESERVMLIGNIGVGNGVDLVER